MLSPCRILYVDDDKDSRELVQAMLHFSDSNYEVTTTESSKVAISLLAKQTFDLFILDYSLPDISGVELCRYIRNDNPSAPIMFLSAMAYPAHRANGLEAGADDYLIKPNDLPRLVDTINRLLDENPQANCKTPTNSQQQNSIY
jgi:OmpR-family two-component system manganese-sensing response regulator